MITQTACVFPWAQKVKYTEKSYLKLVLRHAGNAGLAVDSDVVDEISERATVIFDGDKEFITDEPSQFHLLLTSYLLSAVETLEKISTRDKAKTIAGNAFTENGRVAISLSMKAGMLFSIDKFKFIRKNSGEKVVEAYGRGFDIEVETDHSTYMTTRVKKCGFHEFFVRHGRPELTKLMCEWDNNWSDVLKNSKYVDFDRPTTIAAGDDSCAFQFRKSVE